MILVRTPPFSDSMVNLSRGAGMISKKLLQEENEDLLCIVEDLVSCCEDQGCVLPVDLQERIAEFFIDDEEEDEDHIIDIKPTS